MLELSFTRILLNMSIVMKSVLQNMPSCLIHGTLRRQHFLIFCLGHTMKSPLWQKHNGLQKATEEITATMPVPLLRHQLELIEFSHIARKVDQRSGMLAYKLVETILTTSELILAASTNQAVLSCQKPQTACLNGTQSFQSAMSIYSTVRYVQYKSMTTRNLCGWSTTYTQGCYDPHPALSSRSTPAPLLRSKHVDGYVAAGLYRNL